MLFSIEELEIMRDRYTRAQAANARERCAGFVYQARTDAQWDIRAAQKTRAEKIESDRRVLLEIATEDPTCTVAELADWSERSQSWVRRHLKAAGITLVKPVRRKKAEVQP